MAEIESPTTIAFHVVDGPSKMAPVDAVNAVRDFPREWRLTPWTAEARTAAAAMKSQEAAALTAATLAPNWRDFSPATQRELAVRFGATSAIPPNEVLGFLADIQSRGSGA
jgi:hypothetical protein